MELETDVQAKEFEERLKTDPNSTPFGIPMGAIKMGTLAQVVGGERAKVALARLEEINSNNRRALAELGIRNARY